MEENDSFTDDSYVFKDGLKTLEDVKQEAEESQPSFKKLQKSVTKVVSPTPAKPEKADIDSDTLSKIISTFARKFIQELEENEKNKLLKSFLAKD